MNVMHILALSLTITTTQGLIGYDCGSPRMSTTTISLRDVGECDIPRHPIKTDSHYIQLLQLDDFSTVTVIQCKVEIRRTLYKCGMFSHTSIVPYGTNEYIYEISNEACKDLHRHGSFSLKKRTCISWNKT